MVTAMWNRLRERSRRQILARTGNIRQGSSQSMAAYQGLTAIQDSSFRRTPGRKAISQSCPTIKVLFGKLRNDLSAPKQTSVCQDLPLPQVGFLDHSSIGLSDKAQITNAVILINSDHGKDKSGGTVCEEELHADTDALVGG